MALSKPPKFADKLLSWFIKGDLLEEVLGDLYEYHDEISHLPSAKKKLLYWFHAFHFIRPSLLKTIASENKLSYLGMTKLMFKLSFRQLRKKQLITAVSLITLIVGMLSFQLTYSWIENEVLMDTFHSKKDRITIGVAQLNSEGNLIAPPIARLFQIDYTQYHEIEKNILIHTYMPGEIKFNSNKVSYDGKGLVVDSTFFEFFDFVLLQGSKTSLYDPNSIVITEDFSKKVFKGEQPIGKLIKINCDQEGTYQVAGIVQKIPSNSSVNFDFLIPRHSKTFWRRAPQEIILLKEGAQLSQLNDKITILGEESERFPNSTVFFFPFEDVYHKKPFNITLFSKYGDQSNLGTVKLIAWALLIITIICYTNLQTSVQLSEMDKMKVKHLLGAGKSHLLMEGLVRGLIFFIVAFFISAILYLSFYDDLVTYIGLELDMRPFEDIFIIGLSILFCVLLSSILTSYNVFRSLKDLDIKREKPIHAISQPRKLLAIAQYSITILLLIGSLIVSFQLKYMLNKDLGINQSEIVSTRIFDIIPSNRQDSIKRAKMLNQHRYVLDQISQHPDVVATSQGTPPLGYAYDLPFKVSSSLDDFVPIKTLNVDPGFQDAFDLNVIEGRFYDKNDVRNNMQLVINESAKKFFKIDDITKEKITHQIGNREHQIIGVVEDFHFEHLSREVQPLLLPYFHHPDDEIIIRYQSGKDKEVLQVLEGLYNEVNPEGIFTATFFSDKVAGQYAKEENVRRIYSIFGIIALILSSVTLFSFVYHEANRRTKEVGIRKVNGASPTEIFKMFSLSFLKSIFVSLIISFPIGWYLMETWLENFSNKINQEVWMYLMITLAILSWALIAILWYTIKLSKLNPVDSLRCE